METNNKPNQESRTFGLRYLASFISQMRDLNSPGETDSDLTGEILFLALLNEYNSVRMSQLGQDVLAWSMSNFRKHGYFVEVGASNGVCHSNTYMLEKHLGWSGVLVEANPYLHDQINNNRTAKLIKKAAWSSSGCVLDFHVCKNTSVSALAGLQQNDMHDRSDFSACQVQTMTLNDILSEHSAPSQIDFLSLDVEGAELAVLEGLSLDVWDINAMTIEHNHDANRLISFDNLLLPRGYKRVFTTVSDFDAFYVKEQSFLRWIDFIRPFAPECSLI
ncbi:FkbM family methyltransferase [Methylococcus sp. EFPC2]|uniref:FkbM family methyltransferase n=1 Tax=Methylococcus sp. EFPC2 TaxID=2812648 RepID=UPI001968230E|nr:FkbM family methyltransferase [Methylococcus sp. EFPC2]QSA96820.1 FkbM family methyltransferase [Methylococcus sp. EFPC2]